MLESDTEQRLLGKMRWAGDRDAAVAAEPDSLPVIRTAKDLDRFLLDYFGVRLPAVQVCAEHSTPHSAFHAAYFAASPIAVWKASRGFGGKSFTLSLLGLTEALTLRADVNVLGGSGEQSQRILESMAKLWAWPAAPRQFLRTDPGSRKTVLTFGNTIKALMASQTSVRGPHPQRLRLDECLVVGTRIHTPMGFVNIEDIKPGDCVYCYHADTRTVQPGTVVAAVSRGIRETVRIVFSDGRSIGATPEHPIFTSDGWKRADEATDATSVSFVWDETDSDRTPRGGMPGLLSGETSTEEPGLPEVRGAEERSVYNLSSVLQRAAAKAQSILFGLWRGPERPRRQVPEMSPDLYEREGAGQVRGGRATALGTTRSRPELQAEELLAILGLAFETQIPIGRWVVDFRLIGKPIVIEVHGGYWHDRPAAKIRDAKKRTYLEGLGYQVIALRTDNACLWWLALCPLSNDGRGYVFPSTI